MQAMRGQYTDYLEYINQSGPLRPLRAAVACTDVPGVSANHFPAHIESQPGNHVLKDSESLDLKPQKVLKCVLKNTFLEMVLESPEKKVAARVRSLSESHASESLTRDVAAYDFAGDGAERSDTQSTSKNIRSVSTISSINGRGSSPNNTPRDSINESRTQSNQTNVESQVSSQSSIFDAQIDQKASHTPIAMASPASWYDQTHEEGLEVPDEALEALQTLQGLAIRDNLKREELMTIEATSQLYPYIPFDDEGSVTSLGTILHAEGLCKPCAFFKSDRCHKKDLCLYCHFDHDLAKPRRGKKSRRARLAKQRSYPREQSEEVVRFSL